MSSQIDANPGRYAVRGNPDQVYSGNARTLSSLLNEMKRNFLTKNIELMDGLLFNQYSTLRKIHFYVNSKFIDGETDELGNQKYFHNIINNRNAQATKNIDLDTKDMLIQTDLESGYWLSWVMRMELRSWMDKDQFGKKLNRMAEMLPQMGSFVWKKVLCKDDDGNEYTSIEEVDLRDLMNDQAADSLADSQMIAHRHVMNPDDMRKKVKDGWSEAAINKVIREAGTTGRKQRFLTQVASANTAAYALTDSIPMLEAYEVWGWVPEDCLPGENTAFPLRPKNPDKTKYTYIMAVLSGINAGEAGDVLYAQLADPNDFPYREAHIRKQPGRWLGLGNTELLFSPQVRVNELVNRFFGALRLGSLHVFQTRGKVHVKNLLQDLLDGDIVESSHAIDPLITDLRAFNQYQTEIQNLNALADQICNTPEIVTGESLPSGTPFRLGAELSVNANKWFGFVRQNCGILIGEIMTDWVLPSLVSQLTEEHTLELMGSMDEQSEFMEAYTQSTLLNELKKYVLETGYLPTASDYASAKQALLGAVKNGTKKLLVKGGFVKVRDIKRLRIQFTSTDEDNNKAADQATLGQILQIITPNPAILQDPNIRMIIGRIMEMANISPLKLAGFVSGTPNAPPALGPGGPQPASPGMQAFSANPGDAAPGGGNLPVSGAQPQTAPATR